MVWNRNQSQRHRQDHAQDLNRTRNLSEKLLQQVDQEDANHVIAKPLLKVKKATRQKSKIVIVPLKKAYNDANQVSDQNPTVNKATKSHINK